MRRTLRSPKIINRTVEREHASRAVSSINRNETWHAGRRTKRVGGRSLLQGEKLKLVKSAAF